MATAKAEAMQRALYVRMVEVCVCRCVRVMVGRVSKALLRKEKGSIWSSHI